MPTFVMNNRESTPLFSIITVTYNASSTLDQTLNSLLSQQCNCYEYIIIDGASTDGTLEIIKKHEQYIDHWISEPDDGIYDAMNKGIKLAHGEFIAFINADDWYEPSALNLMADAILKHRNIDFFYANINNIFSNGTKSLWKSKPNKHGLGIPHPSIFIRSTILKQHYFNTNYKIAADTDLTLTLFKQKITTYYLDATIANYRQGGASANFIQTQRENFVLLYRHINVFFALKQLTKSLLFKLYLAFFGKIK